MATGGGEENVLPESQIAITASNVLPESQIAITASNVLPESHIAIRARNVSWNLDWEEYFMGMAAMASVRSKADVKVGAVIVNQENMIVGIGYNGMPLHISDEDWTPELERDLVCDAHSNALSFRSVVDLSGCRMYTTGFPTMESAKLIIQNRITNLHFMSKGTDQIQQYSAIKTILGLGRVTVTQFRPRPSRGIIAIDLLDYGVVMGDIQESAP